MSVKYWMLVGHTPIECSQMEWAQMIESGSRVLALTKLKDPEDNSDVLVSTVFLGIDHSFSMRAMVGHPDHIPDLFETMVFGGATNDGVTLRTRSWDEAVAMHWQTVQNCRDGQSA